MKTQNLKYFGVTILTFRGHVTSSVTWPADSAWALCYWWSKMHGYGDRPTGPQQFWGHEFDPLGCILHCCGYMGPQIYWGHDLDLLGSRDVIGHVTSRLGVGTFLLVVNDDHASILHGCRDTGPQRFWGHDLDLLGSRDVFGYVTIKLGMWFPIGGLLEPCVYLAPLWR